MKYEVVIARTYCTVIEIEAGSEKEAEDILYHDHPTRERMYAAELEQCDVEERVVMVSPIIEKQ